MKNNLDLSLYLVTDSTYHTEESLLYTVEEACKGGVTMCSFARRIAGGGIIWKKPASSLRAITDRYHIPLIIDDQCGCCHGLRCCRCSCWCIRPSGSRGSARLLGRIKLWEQPRKR